MSDNSLFRTISMPGSPPTPMDNDRAKAALKAGRGKGMDRFINHVLFDDPSAPTRALIVTGGAEPLVMLIAPKREIAVPALLALEVEKALLASVEDLRQTESAPPDLERNTASLAALIGNAGRSAVQRKTP